jgi:hypothetical protein
MPSIRLLTETNPLGPSNGFSQSRCFCPAAAQRTHGRDGGRRADADERQGDGTPARLRNPVRDEQTNPEGERRSSANEESEL